MAGLAELLLRNISQEAIASAPFPIKRNGRPRVGSRCAASGLSAHSLRSLSCFPRDTALLTHLRSVTTTQSTVLHLAASRGHILIVEAVLSPVEPSRLPDLLAVTNRKAPER